MQFNELECLTYLLRAVSEAEQFQGATAPNPPVGAVVVSSSGKILAVGAHEGVHTPHAEVAALTKARELHGAEALKGALLFVTLEPCNHFGRTPPCTHAILEAGIGHVIYGCRDVNPKVTGSGAQALRDAGVTVTHFPNVEACERLIKPFSKWVLTQTPYVVHKLAYRIRDDGTPTMIPDERQKTFTSEEALTVAHKVRKQSDAIITSLETVIADDPQFNVRHVKDHSNKTRFIAVVNRSARPLPQAWVSRQESLGFKVLQISSLELALKQLGSLGVLQVLIEAGPRLSKVVVENKLWDERLVFLHPHGFWQEQRVEGMERI
jgi:diaminohydroxyphosphoribosylaminopyrimidine deaminase/5-amino-6-(5-phosphoribosylamino)uracil reductase